VTTLRMIYAIAGMWGGGEKERDRQTRQPRDLIPILWYQSRKVETITLKCVIAKVSIPNIETVRHVFTAHIKADHRALHSSVQLSVPSHIPSSTATRITLTHTGDFPSVPSSQNIIFCN
jgi:hypothetical protein